MYCKLLNIPGEPDTTTAQEKGVKIVRSRTGRYYPQFYEKEKVKKAKDHLAFYLRQYAPKEPLTGPIGIKIEYHFGRGSKPKKYIGAPKDTKPDLDNMAKALLDVMTKLKFWNDDAQVVNLQISKNWSEDEEAGIWIVVTQLQEVI